MTENTRGWILLSKTPDDYRRPTGGVHYDDDPAIHYSWDSSVPNHANIQSGDVIVVRNQTVSLGISVIESIDLGEGTKTRYRCPHCGSTSIERRSTMRHAYRCDAKLCAQYFDEPVSDIVNVVTYRSSHAQAWVDLDGLYSAKELQRFCTSPGSQNSLRPLDVEKFRVAVIGVSDANPFRILDGAALQIGGGHVETSRRVRLGRGAFRKKLQEVYGDVCAFTGPQPGAVLDACHLYSYAKVGEHKDQGGILLRKDLRQLFDRGLVAVDSDGNLDLVPVLLKYPAYEPMHGQSLHIELTVNQRTWVREHWDQWRSDRS